MPTFEAELADGRKIQFEADRQPTEEELAQAVSAEAPAQPKTSALGTFAREFAASAPGTAAFALTAPTAAAATLPAGPLVSGGAGIIAGTAADIAISKGTRKLLGKVVPGFIENLEAGEREHPRAAFLGGLASGGVGFKFATAPAEWGLKQLVKRAAVGGALGAVVPPIVQQRLPDVSDIASGAAFTTLYGGSRFKPLLPRARAAASGERTTDASSQQEAAALHGDVRSQQEPTGELPVQEGQPGVQPQAQAVAQKAQVLLKPRITPNADGTYKVSQQLESGPVEVNVPTLEDAHIQADLMEGTARGVKEPVIDVESEQQAIDAAAEKGLKAEVTDAPPDENVPWARSFGESVAYLAPDGKVYINRKNFHTTLGRYPENRARIIQSLVGEEHIHSFVTDDDATAFAKNMTSAERKLLESAYLGPGETFESTGLSEAQIGHEGIRRSLQYLARLPMLEVEEKASALGRFSQRTIAFLEQLIRKLRTALGTKASKVQQEILDRVQANLEPVTKGEGTAARMRRRETSEQGMMFLPPPTGAVERPGAEELGSKQGLPVTPKAVEETAASHLQEGKKPSFDSFVKEVQGKFGDVQKEQLWDTWKDSVTKYLMGDERTNIKPASGEELQNLWRKLGITKDEAPPAIADPPSLETPEVKQQLIMGQVAPTFTPRQRARLRAISKIQERLFARGPEPKVLTRKSVAPEEVAHWRSDVIDLGSHISRDELGRVLTTDARASGKVVSATKRVTAMRDKATGKVYLSGTFLDPRRGAVIVDPQSPGRTTSQLDSILKRYDLITSYPLDEPVKGFLQSFDSLPDFSEKFSKPVREIVGKAEGRAQRYEAADFSAAYEPRSGETIPGVYQQAPGVIERAADVPLTDAEAGSVLDHVLEETGKFEGPEDVFLAMEGLKDKKRWDVIAAYQKIFSALQRKNPDMAAVDVMDRMAKEIYETHKASSSYEDFIQRTQAAYNRPDVKPLSAATPATPREVATGAKELTMRERIPPTVTRGEVLPKGAPEPRLPAPVEPEQMTPEERAFVDREAAIKYAAREGAGARMRNRESWQEGQGYEGRLFGGAYDASGLRFMGRGAPMRQAIMLARERYNDIREAFGLSKVSEWTKRPDDLIQRLPPPEPTAARMRRAREVAEDAYVELSGKVTAALTRSELKSDIAGLRDGADTVSRVMGENAKQEIILKSASKKMKQGNPEVLAAARAVNAAYEYDPATRTFKPEPARYADFLNDLATAEVEARNMLASSSRRDRYAGRRWLKGVEDLRKEVLYAQTHHGDAELMDTAKQLRSELFRVLREERRAGFNVKEKSNYLPGLYEGELFNDDSVTFGPAEFLGKRYAKPSVFRNYYEAISKGPFVPISNNVADLVGHRVRAGHQRIFEKKWFAGIKNLNDPRTAEPIAIDAVESPSGGFQNPPGSENRTLVYLNRGGKPLSVLKGYSRLMDNMVGTSGLQNFAAGKFAINLNAKMKHGILLIFDSFHLGRLLDYAVAANGRNAGWNGGYSALEFRRASLPDAVSKGLISQQAADWASSTINVKRGNTITPMSHMELSNELQKIGLNVGRVHDALYMHFADKMPLAGKFNRWLFDRFTRGLMLQTAVEDFKKLNQKYPNYDVERLMRMVVKDTNAYYGSLGRQGVIKSPTGRDMANLMLLAPQWVEGLLRKELTLYGRLIAAPYNLAKGQPVLGTIGKGMGRGLLAMFAITQMLNLITKKHPTWDNEEEGHKLDAWIPSFSGKKEGFWLSPLSLFAEITHDLVRLAETKPRVWDAVRQIGENKLGFAGRLGLVLATGRGPTGEYPTSTGGVLKTAASQVLPYPIAFSKMMQAGAHAAAPGTFPAVPGGGTERQAYASLGIKMEPGRSPAQQMSDMAKRFVVKEKLAPEMVHLEATDEASYTKLRAAIRNNDTRGAAVVLQDLRKTRTDAAILKAMKIWAKRPWTGSQAHERLFLNSLDNQQLELYTKATQERFDDLDAFYDFFLMAPTRE